MDGAILRGLLEVVAISLVPVAVVAAGLHASLVRRLLVRLGRRLHVVAPEPPPPAGPPLEKLAADLRRLRPLARTPAPGVPMARQRGIVAAYEMVLLDTARALAIPTNLADLPVFALERESERLRLEHELTQAGLSWELHRP